MPTYSSAAYFDPTPYYDYFENTTDGLHRTIGGHDVKIYLETSEGEVLIGRAQSLTGQRDFGVESVYECGSMKPQEFVPARYSGTITLNRYLVRYDDMVAALTRAGAPFSLGREGRILLHSVRGLTVKVVDTFGQGNPIREYRNCVVSNCSEDFRAGALCGETMTLLYAECIASTEPLAIQSQA